MYYGLQGNRQVRASDERTVWKTTLRKSEYRREDQLILAVSLLYGLLLGVWSVGQNEPLLPYPDREGEKN